MKKITNFTADAMDIVLNAIRAADKVILEEINQFEDCNIAFQAQVYQMMSEMFFAMCQMTSQPLELSDEALNTQKEQFFSNSKKFEQGMCAEMIKVTNEQANRPN